MDKTITSRPSNWRNHSLDDLSVVSVTVVVIHFTPVRFGGNEGSSISFKLETLASPIGDNFFRFHNIWVKSWLTIACKKRGERCHQLCERNQDSWTRTRQFLWLATSPLTYRPKHFEWFDQWAMCQLPYNEISIYYNINDLPSITQTDPFEPKPKVKKFTFQFFWLKIHAMIDSKVKVNRLVYKKTLQINNSPTHLKTGNDKLGLTRKKKVWKFTKVAKKWINNSGRILFCFWTGYINLWWLRMLLCGAHAAMQIAARKWFNFCRKQNQNNNFLRPQEVLVSFLAQQKSYSVSSLLKVSSLRFLHFKTGTF